MEEDEQQPGMFYRYRCALQAVMYTGAVEVSGPERETRGQAEDDIPNAYASLVGLVGPEWEKRQGIFEVIIETRYDGFVA